MLKGFLVFFFFFYLRFIFAFQVRETFEKKLEEKDKKNMELQEKLLALQEKLVVSTLQIPKKISDKEKVSATL